MPSEDQVQTIRNARAHSNRSIARRNLLGVADSLAEDFVVILGDGTHVPTRAAYLKLFKQEFDSKQSLRYERLPTTITISDDQQQAAETGHWTASQITTNTLTHTGHYTAMWRNAPDGWKLRAELFVTLTSANVR